MRLKLDASMRAETQPAGGGRVRVAGTFRTTVGSLRPSVAVWLRMMSVYDVTAEAVCVIKRDNTVALCSRNYCDITERSRRFGPANLGSPLT